MSQTAALPIAGLDDDTPPALRVRGYWSTVGYRLRHDPVTLCFGAIVLLIVLSAIFAPLLAPFDPYKESVVLRLKPFGYRGHPLGTDELGRDLLSRLIYGARPALYVGVAAVGLGGTIGIVLGLLAGYTGGKLDAVTGRMCDALFGIPIIVLAVAVVAAIGRSPNSVAVAVALGMIPSFARLARASTLRERNLEYIEACRSRRTWRRRPRCSSSFISR